MVFQPLGAFDGIRFDALCDATKMPGFERWFCSCCVVSRVLTIEQIKYSKDSRKVKNIPKQIVMRTYIADHEESMPKTFFH